MLAIPAEEYSCPEKLCKTPTVSVLMLAYQHADFIEESVASVVAQKTSFEIELLIGEDCSPDGTRELCKKLLNQHPNIIRLITSDANIGIIKNFLRLLVRARGRYIALLDGDDYWIVQDKLSAQVALLEDNPNYSWSGTRTANKKFWVHPQSSYGLQEVLLRYIVHTSSVLFRAECITRWPCFPSVVCLDHLLFAYLAAQGRCGFIDRETSYYRRHDGGVWSGAEAGDRLEMTARCIDAVNDFFDGRYCQELNNRELWIYSMSITPNLNRTVKEQWRLAWMVGSQAARRTLAAAPVACIRLLIVVGLLPVLISYKKMRRALGLRKRLERTIGILKI